MDGILLIDKPAGLTSHDVVDRIRKIAGTRAVGHAGTLDPMATGLLIVGIGKATKELSRYVGLDKEYEAELTLGATSDTFDAEGVIQKNPDVRRVTREEIERTLERFRGTFEQKAPLFSAKKIQGKKLYDLARAGTATEEMRPVKRVTISALDIMKDDFPKLTVRVRCSSGTYIRSLADDIGRALGVGAYLTNLRRTAVGPYMLKDARPLAECSREHIIKAVKTRLDNAADE